MSLKEENEVLKAQIASQSGTGVLFLFEGSSAFEVKTWTGALPDIGHSVVLDDVRWLVADVTWRFKQAETILERGLQITLEKFEK